MTAQASRKSSNPTPLPPLTWAEVDCAAVRYNIAEIQRLASRNTFSIPTRTHAPTNVVRTPDILAVVKANAYGHGMTETSRLLEEAGIMFFAVSDVEEGVRLRGAGIKTPILLFESTLPEYAPYIIKHDLTPTVCTLELAQTLNQLAEAEDRPCMIHVEIDTGMGRLGIWHEEAMAFVQSLIKFPFLRIQGIYTHFPVADTDKRFTEKQVQQLFALVHQLDKAGIVIPYIHAANSMGLGGYKTDVLNLVRPGLMIYGLYPNVELQEHIELKPALSIRSRVIFLKNIESGRGVSYGRTFISKKMTRAATIPIGYNDGYPVGLSNKSSVLIRGQRCPVIGKVTMDQIVVDVSEISDPELNLPVTILGRDGQEEVSADELAGYLDTINYEIVCGLGNRLPKIFV